MTGLIYCLTHRESGKKYVGQTVATLSHRMSQHRAEAARRSQMVIHKAIRKYGFAAFNVSVLEASVPLSQINEREIYYISTLLSRTTQHGYNMTAGGDGRPDCPMTEETKQRISLAKAGTNVGRHNPRWGVAHTEEARRKISAAHKGRKHSDESRRINSLSKTGEKNHFLGKQHTLESRQRMSESHKGQIAWNKGKKRDPELVARVVEIKRRNREARRLANG